MLVKVIRWILHWLGQGLKLWLFAAVASICVVPIYLPLGLLKGGAYHFDDLFLLSKIGIVAGYIVCYAISIAVFTAVLASQLKEHPLRSFIPETGRKNKSTPWIATGGISTENPTQCEQDAGGNRR
jgi:hypothetical protein